MDYARIYRSLVERARLRTIKGPAERHHVLPRCLGGKDERENVVSLTPREHHFAHQLLVRMHPGKTGLIAAALMMSGRKRVGLHHSRKYDWLRRRYLQGVKGKPKSEQHRAKLSAARMGQRVSEATKGKISAASRGRVVSDETRARCSLAKRGKPQPANLGNKSRTGMPNSAETRRLIAQANSGKKHSAEWAQNIAIGSAKIPDDVVRAIRSEYAARALSQGKLAAKYGIGQSHISRIVLRRTYGWIE